MRRYQLGLLERCLFATRFAAHTAHSSQLTAHTAHTAHRHRHPTLHFVSFKMSAQFNFQHLNNLQQSHQLQDEQITDMLGLMWAQSGQEIVGMDAGE